jgi:CxxC motif-containing protein (DUF1111 family)
MNRPLLLLPALCLSLLLTGCESPTLLAAWQDLTAKPEPAAAEPAASAAAPEAPGRPPVTAVPAASPVAASSAAAAVPPAPAAPPALGPLVPTTGTPRDPGPRPGDGGAGAALPGLDAAQQAAFRAGRSAFLRVYGVKEGLGPVMNLDHCAGCHSHPAVGGTSGAVNPQVAFARKGGAANAVPKFISLHGPARVARFVRGADGSPDGTPRRLFTIAGRQDAPPGCRLAQPDFEQALQADNVVTRIATPLFGAGLMEQVPDRALTENLARDAQRKAELGIRGKTNNFGRFGWKAQQRSLLQHSAGAYGGELGLSSRLAPQEPAGADACQVGRRPNLVAPPEQVQQGGRKVPGTLEMVVGFLRLLAPPAPSLTEPGGGASIANGRRLFITTGCDLCHTPQLVTASSAPPPLREQVLNLYSDLLLHDMGAGLADFVRQGDAGGREWRTAPLWGLGQRLFLLHDGRTSDLREAVLAHRSPGSEANAVIERYVGLSDADEQDLLNFLRSL